MSSRAVRLLMLASLCTAATVAAAPGANAGSRFDGRWSAVLRTQSGPCQPAYRGAVEVATESWWSQALPPATAFPDASRRTDRCGPTGYMGSNYGVASGRLSGNSGGGTWRARMENGSCSGVSTAQRQASR
jgi:hypothetical protein